MREYRNGVAVIVFAVIGLLPHSVAADDVPSSVVALLPAGAKLGSGSWAVFDTEFGKTFGGDMQASSFPGQRPTCAFGGTPALHIDLKGDTAWENPPMLDMAISIHDDSVKEAPAAMSRHISGALQSAPDVVSVGDVHEEARPGGDIVYVEYKEHCANRPNGAKTKLRGFARRGATQLEFNMVVALDATAATKLADEILERFGKLDIAALTP